MTEALPHTTARRIRGGWIWFALMVAAWAAFFALLVLSDPTLAELWVDVRDLPLLGEALAWLAFFPLVLALAVWNADWEAWLRLLLVACFALGWSAAFFPRPTNPTARRTP